MDQNRAARIKQLAGKYNYVLLILVLGIFLMLLPNTGNGTAASTQIAAQDAPEKEALQDQLSQLLSQVDGAGKVRVLLTEAVGERRIFQTNDNHSADERADSHKIDTVILTDGSRNQTGLVQQINPPTYLGAIVLCHGAEKPSVKLALTEAISNATGLSYNKITILKMK